jgi:hypothetical protein
MSKQTKPSIVFAHGADGSSFRDRASCGQHQREIRGSMRSVSTACVGSSPR